MRPIIGLDVRVHPWRCYQAVDKAQPIFYCMCVFVRCIKCLLHKYNCNGGGIRPDVAAFVPETRCILRWLSRVDNICVAES